MEQLDGEEWVRRFAELAGSTAPSETEIGKLLKLAADAAHSSERIAAPLACWVAGRAGLDLDEAIALAGRVGDGADG
jgi:uncharacterized protein DUF6457